MKYCNKKDLLGMRFGRLVVISFSYVCNHHKAYWNCLCDCGKEIIVYRGNLKNGHTQSCGCIAIEKLKARGIYNAKQAGESNKSSAFNYYKQNARKRNKSFELSREEFIELVSGKCYYCGVEPFQVLRKSKYGTFVYNGIDRVDTTKGYTKDNCVSCCKHCNSIKRGCTIKIARKMIEFEDNKEII